MKKKAHRKRRGNGKAMGDTSKHVTQAKQKREGEERGRESEGRNGGVRGKARRGGLGIQKEGGADGAHKP